MRAVIFDVDGTLVDSVDLHASAWQATFHHFGKEVAFQDIRQQIGKGGDHLLPVFFSKEQIERQGKQIAQHKKDLFSREYMSRVKPLPGVRPLFELLRDEGKRVALASSAKDEELKKYERIAGIEDLLDAETSSDDAAKSKPDPDIFEAALGRLKGIDPGSVIAVGDTPYDAEAAGKTGVRTVGVLSGGFSEQQLRAAGCVEIYPDVSYLLANYRNSALAR